MRVLVIAPQPFFTPRGTPFSVYYRTLVMSELDAEIDVLTYGEGIDVDIPNVRIIRTPRFGFLGKIKTGPSLLKLFLDVFVFFWTVGLLIRNRYRVVHAHEEAVFFSRFLKPIFGFKLIYDMHSSLPEQLTNFNFTQSRFLIGVFKRLEDSALHAADAVITICPALQNYVNSIIADTHKHLLIENSIFDEIRIANTSMDNSDDGINSELLEPLLSQKLPLVVYTGTLEFYQGVDVMIKAFSLYLQAKPKSAVLAIVGGSPEQVAKYSKQAADCGLDNESVVFTGRVPQASAHRLIDHASVLMSPRSEGTNTPLKIYQQLASGKPIVATNIYSHTQVLDDSVAILVDLSPADMARGIEEALSSGERQTQRVDAAQTLYENKYSRKAYTEKMKHLLELVS